MELLATQIAPAVRNAQLYEQSRQAENELRQRAASAKALLESAPQGIIVTSSSGEIVQVNDAALGIFGYSGAELLGKQVEVLLPQDSRPGHSGRRESYISDPVARPMGTGRELKGLRKDGSLVPLEIGLSSVSIDGGSVALAFISDITERKAAEEAKRQWTEETSVMAEIGRTVCASLDINEVYQNLAKEIRKLIPFDRFQMSLVDLGNETTSPVWVIGTDVPGRREGTRVPLEGSVSSEVVHTKSPVMLAVETEAEAVRRFPALRASFRAGLRSFVVVPLIVRGAVIGILRVASTEKSIYTRRHLELLERIGGQIGGAIANSQTYTRHIEAQERIKSSLLEKEVLLKEINPWVKNNLQIISSLLHLQSLEIQDAQALHSFQVSRDRILAIALVHEKLYQSDDLARIDFGEYIRRLADGLRSSYGLGLQNVNLKIDVYDILLGVDQAIPCGVIVNELVANSLKHAFPGGRPGEIAIGFRDVNGQYTMTFKDDGVGFPTDLDISRPSSLGLTIVKALTEQLGGAIGMGRNGACEIEITFPSR
jgi:PAS domain S-box-containing protein